VDRLRHDDADVTTMFWCQRDENSDFPMEYLRGRRRQETHVRNSRAESACGDATFTTQSRSDVNKQTTPKVIRMCNQKGQASYRTPKMPAAEQSSADARRKAAREVIDILHEIATLLV
jgi:hypothetical protein